MYFRMFDIHNKRALTKDGVAEAKGALRFNDLDVDKFYDGIDTEKKGSIDEETWIAKLTGNLCVAHHPSFVYFVASS